MRLKKKKQTKLVDRKRKKWKTRKKLNRHLCLSPISKKMPGASVEEILPSSSPSSYENKTVRFAEEESSASAKPDLFSNNKTHRPSAAAASFSSVSNNLNSSSSSLGDNTSTNSTNSTNSINSINSTNSTTSTKEKSVHDRLLSLEQHVSNIYVPNALEDMKKTLNEMKKKLDKTQSQTQVCMFGMSLFFILFILVIVLFVFLVFHYRANLRRLWFLSFGHMSNNSGKNVQTVTSQAKDEPQEDVREEEDEGTYEDEDTSSPPDTTTTAPPVSVHQPNKTNNFPTSTATKAPSSKTSSRYVNTKTSPTVPRVPAGSRTKRAQFEFIRS